MSVGGNIDNYYWVSSRITLLQSPVHKDLIYASNVSFVIFFLFHSQWDSWWGVYRQGSDMPEERKVRI